MTVIILAGPPAVGHNTIGELLGQLRPRFAVIDVDDVRAMERSPAPDPWEGQAGEERYRRSIRRACLIARDFDKDGYDVVVLDVAPPETLDLFRAELAGLSALKIVLLLADPEILIERDVARDETPDPDPGAIASWHDRIRFLHGQLAEAAGSYDVVIDNGRMTAEETAEKVAALF